RVLQIQPLVARISGARPIDAEILLQASVLLVGATELAAQNRSCPAPQFLRRPTPEVTEVFPDATGGVRNEIRGADPTLHRAGQVERGSRAQGIRQIELPQLPEGLAVSPLGRLEQRREVGGGLF